MDIVVMAGVLANVGVLGGLLGGMIYGYGILNSTVKSMKEDISEIRNELNPRLTELTRLETVVISLTDAVKGLQESLRTDLTRRITKCESDIREIVTRCIERNHGHSHECEDR